METLDSARPPICLDVAQLRSLSHVSQQQQTLPRLASSALAPFGEPDALAAAALAASSKNIHDGWKTEVFNLRQPDHVILAGQLGLGVFDWERIAYRRV